MKKKKIILRTSLASSATTTVIVSGYTDREEYEDEKSRTQGPLGEGGGG